MFLSRDQNKKSKKNSHFVSFKLGVDDRVGTFSAWRLILIECVLNGIRLHEKHPPLHLCALSTVCIAIVVVVIVIIDGCRNQRIVIYFWIGAPLRL